MRTRCTDVTRYGAVIGWRRCTPRRRRTFAAYTGVESRPLADRLFFLRESAIVGTRIILTRLSAIGRHPKWYVTALRRRYCVRSSSPSCPRHDEYFCLTATTSRIVPRGRCTRTRIASLSQCAFPLLSSPLCALDGTPGRTVRLLRIAQFIPRMVLASASGHPEDSPTRGTIHRRKPSPG